SAEGLLGMPQLIIDPRYPGNPAGSKFITQIRPKTRKFGFVPDLMHCKAGDLILFQSPKPGWIEKRIASAQIRAGFDSEHSCWTHAAVFLYEDFIVEADPWKGVISRSLYSDIPDSILRIRRRYGITDKDGYKVALCAQRMLGMRYSFGAA